MDDRHDMLEKRFSFITTKYKVINIKIRNKKDCNEKKQELSACYFKHMYIILRRICSDEHAYSRLLKI